jgi:hypothetical protein
VQGFTVIQAEVGGVSFGVGNVKEEKEKEEEEEEGEE